MISSLVLQRHKFGILLENFILPCVNCRGLIGLNNTIKPWRPSKGAIASLAAHEGDVLLSPHHSPVILEKQVIVANCGEFLVNTHGKGKEDDLCVRFCITHQLQCGQEVNVPGRQNDMVT